jgi:hypothetical protein
VSIFGRVAANRRPPDISLEPRESTGTPAQTAGRLAPSGRGSRPERGARGPNGGLAASRRIPEGGERGAGSSSDAVRGGHGVIGDFRGDLL